MAETKLNYEEVRKALDRVMEKTGKKTKDIGKKEIIEELKAAGITASHSTSGPIVRSVLDDAELAKSFSIDDIQSFLLAGFIKDRLGFSKFSGQRFDLIRADVKFIGVFTWARSGTQCLDRTLTANAAA